jgi:hypothetical protein
MAFHQHPHFIRAFRAEESLSEQEEGSFPMRHALRLGNGSACWLRVVHPGASIGIPDVQLILLSEDFV